MQALDLLSNALPLSLTYPPINYSNYSDMQPIVSSQTTQHHIKLTLGCNILQLTLQDSVSVARQ